MFGFRRRPEQSCQHQLEALEKRIERLEEVEWQGRAQQLEVMERLVTRLNQRVSKRAPPPDPEPEPDNGDAAAPPALPVPSSAHLARRFRGF